MISEAFREWAVRHRRRRALRALERQSEYQHHIAPNFVRDSAVMPPPSPGKRAAADELLSHLSIPEGARLLEVGPGARGLLFHLPGGGIRIGVDPLAVEYRFLFPAWTGRVQMCASFGEALPFRADLFDVVLCDNVIDHAEDPAQILRELVRVLKPDGTFYFTVNVHHPVYHLASSAHAFWNALGLRVEIGPFADHTVHLTIREVRRMRAALPLTTMVERHEMPEARPDGLAGFVKRRFPKNARYVLIAKKRAP